MKKRILSALLCLLMISGVVSCAFIPAGAEDSPYTVGDIIEYGTYPQSLVTDEALLSALSKIPGEWKTYKYYTRGYREGDLYYAPKISQNMQYIDVVRKNVKYRGVKINDYRPFSDVSIDDETCWTQNLNGYTAGNIYWFRYDPLRWRVLDPAEGLVVCDTIIDSQPFVQFADYYAEFGYPYTGEYGLGTAGGGYMTAYYESISVWLNEDFSATAFSEEQKQNIAQSEQVNDYWYVGSNGGTNNGFHKYDNPATQDKIFLLSWDDLTNESYGFNTAWDAGDSARVRTCTDYAKAQGIYDTGSGCRWLIRTVCQYFTSNFSCRVSETGEGMAITYNDLPATSDDRSVFYGICPAMRLENLVSQSSGEDLYHTGDIISFGSYPRSRVRDSDITAALNERVELAPKKNLYIEEHRWAYDADYYTDYADMILDGSRYRAKILYVEMFTEASPSATDQPRVFSDYDYRYTEDGFDKYVYYYRFEPIQWRLLDPETGLMVSDEIVDSAIFRYNHFKSEDDYWAEYAWGDEEHTHYATDYSVSEMRNFLTGSFYEAAFTDEQKAKLKTVELDNRCRMSIDGETGYEEFDWENTSDKVFLLSSSDVVNSGYGFNPDPSAKDSARVMFGNDYSGYIEGETLDNWWPLRNVTGYGLYLSRRPGACTDKGVVHGTAAWANEKHPVVPAICLSEIDCDYSGETAVCGQHSPATVTVTPASCTEPGAGKEICSLCGEILNESVTISAKGHTQGEEKIENESESICTEPGSYDKVIYCTVCGGEISRETVNTDPLGHDEITHEGKASTCKERGWKPYVTCSRCDYTTYEELPLAEHTPGEAVRENETPATCTEGGSYDSVVRCEVCGEILKTEQKETEATGHTYTDKVTPPTCTERGYTTHTCSCGESYIDSYKNALGHSFKDYKYNNDATTERDGTETAKCERCTATDTRTKPGTRLPANPTAGAVLNVRASQTVDYRSKVTVTATAANVPQGYFLAVYDANGEIKRGSNSDVSYNAGEMRNGRIFTVKIIDGAGNVQRDAGGAALQKNCEVKVKTGFFDKIIAFFRGLFGLLPEVEIRP